MHVERNGMRRQSPRRRNTIWTLQNKKNGDVLSAAALIPEQRERASKTSIKPPAE